MTQIRARKESHAILQKLSELTGLSITEIISQWTSAMKPILDEKVSEGANRLGLASWRHNDTKTGKPSNVVVTSLVSFFVGSRKELEIIEVPKNG